MAADVDCTWVAALTVPELKNFLQSRDLPIWGLKANLVNRAAAALQEEEKAKQAASLATRDAKRRAISSSAREDPKPKKTAGGSRASELMPESWLARCVDKWDLVGPHDPLVTESQWESYYKERAALEWYTNAITAGWTDCLSDPRARTGPPQVKRRSPSSAPAVHMAPAALKWKEDFEPPVTSLNNFCHEFYEEYTYNPSWGSAEWEVVSGMTMELRRGIKTCLQGCAGMQDVEGTARRLASGMFLLHFWVNAEDEEPRTIEMTTRLYAPNATGHALEFKYSYHHRYRSMFAESFSNCEVTFRPIDCTQPLQPQGLADLEPMDLFAMDLEDNGHEKRRFMNKQVSDCQHLINQAHVRAEPINSLLVELHTLARIASWLLGQPNIISERKAMTLAVRASGLGLYETGRTTYVMRVTRRKHKLGPGEDSEDRSDDDDESGNDTPRRPRAKANTQGRGRANTQGRAQNKPKGEYVWAWVHKVAKASR